MTLKEEADLAHNRQAYMLTKRLWMAADIGLLKEYLAELSRLFPRIKFRFDPLQKELTVIHHQEDGYPVVLGFFAACRIAVTSPTTIEVGKDLLNSGSIQSDVGKWSHFQRCLGLPVSGEPDVETLTEVQKIWQTGFSENKVQ